MTGLTVYIKPKGSYFAEGTTLVSQVGHITPKPEPERKPVKPISRPVLVIAPPGVTRGKALAAYTRGKIVAGKAIRCIPASGIEVLFKPGNKSGWLSICKRREPEIHCAYGCKQFTEIERNAERLFGKWREAYLKSTFERRQARRIKSDKRKQERAKCYFALKPNSAPTAIPAQS